MKTETIELNEPQKDMLTKLFQNGVTVLEEAGDKRTVNALIKRSYVTAKETKKGTNLRVTAAGKKFLN